MPKRLPWQLQSFSQIPQPPKQERQEASDFYQWCVKQPEKRDEKSASVPKHWPKAEMFRPSKEAWKQMAHSFHIPICYLEAGEEWTRLPWASYTEPQERALIRLPADVVPVK